MPAAAVQTKKDRAPGQDARPQVGVTKRDDTNNSTAGAVAKGAGAAPSISAAVAFAKAALGKRFQAARNASDDEATFLRGCDRHNAPLLFFIPSGAAWDAGYFDRLSDSHCVMPYRFVYPAGHPGPQLAPGGATTTSSHWEQ